MAIYMKQKELAKMMAGSLKELQNQVTESALEVQKNIGPGFKSPDYCRALAHEFKLREIPFQENIDVNLQYKGDIAGKYQLDFVIDKKVIVSVLSTEEISESDRSRQKKFLKALAIDLGVVVNFANERVEIKAVHR